MLKFWAQDNVHGQKVNCELVAVVKTADGEKLSGGGTDVESAVDDLIAAPSEDI